MFRIAAFTSAALAAKAASSVTFSKPVTALAIDIGGSVMSHGRHGPEFVRRVAQKWGAASLLSIKIVDYNDARADLPKIDQEIADISSASGMQA
ncbi:hypothetical protein [Rhizobium sp. BK251]|uniref:hypothetical protein n=1 Tax=Rhizobium sp. BK251 TaxID=2512125 RepID=UPI001404F102|nr:hypothetical protein [Rhizobium sp. BK251]